MERKEDDFKHLNISVLSVEKYEAAVQYPEAYQSPTRTRRSSKGTEINVYVGQPCNGKYLFLIFVTLHENTRLKLEKSQSEISVFSESALIFVWHKKTELN